MPAPEIRHPQDSIDYSQNVAQPSPAEANNEPDSIDYFPSIEKPSPIIQSPVETSLPAAASDTSLQPSVGPCVAANLDPAPKPAAVAVIEEKSSSKRRGSHRRGAQRDRVP